MNRDTAGALLVLDAHPLLREYFARELREQRPEAWRAAHRRLYEHLCATTKDKAQPSCPRSKTGELHRIVDSVRLNLREAEGPSTEMPQARRGSKIDWTCRRGYRPAGLNSESSSAFAENTPSIQCSVNFRAPTLASRVMTWLRLRPRKKSTTKWRRRDFHNGRSRNRA